MRAPIRCRGPLLGGGITGHDPDRLYEEISFLAYHFHWDYETLMNMEHRERKRWCQEVSRINKEMNSDKKRQVPLMP